MDWYQVFIDPVWPKKGLRSELQQTLAIPSRYLPTPDVTVIISFDSDEGADSASFTVWAHGEIPDPVDLTAVDVAITEVLSDDTRASASIKEIKT